MENVTVMPPKDGRVFVRGLAAGTGEADLLRHFDRYGVVDEVSILRVVGEVDSLTGLPALRFAIVKFGHPEFAPASPSTIGSRSSTARRRHRAAAAAEMGSPAAGGHRRAAAAATASPPVNRWSLVLLQEQSMRKRDDVLQILPRGSSRRVDSFHVFSQVLET
uniref:RRM domain-containing protein n=1 Tax=Oryza nivara TaxID=4536 RepID=A0A0E0JCQ4_ORYNI